MDIEFEEAATGGRYFIPDAAGPAPELTFHYNDDGSITADHTFVPHRLRGKGIAQQLVDRLIADARAKGWKIVPACSYVEAQFRRHPEWADLLAA